MKIARPKGKWKAKASGTNCAESNSTQSPLAEPLVGKENSQAISETINPILAGNTKLDSKTVHREGVNNPKSTMGSAVSADPALRRSLNLAKTGFDIPETVEDLRDTAHVDLLQVNTTGMEEPARRLLYPDQGWATLETGQRPPFPAGPLANPQMDHLDRRARSRVHIPFEILPVIKHRMLCITPELVTECPNDEWTQTTLGDALVFLSKTGSGEIRNDLWPRSLYSVEPIHRRCEQGGPPLPYFWAI